MDSQAFVNPQGAEPDHFLGDVAGLDPQPLTIDQLIRARVAISGDDVLLSYPASGTDYVDYTPRQLNAFAFQAAQHYLELGAPRRTCSTEKPPVIGLLGPSNLDYVVSMLALAKLGYTVLLLSPRITEQAHRSLLTRTEATDLVHHRSFASSADSLRAQLDLRVYPIATRETYECHLPHGTHTAMDMLLDSAIENRNTALIIHSSGSTSFPKPVFLSNFALLTSFSTSQQSLTILNTLPLHHMYGNKTFMKAWYTGQRLYLYSADLPLTASHVKKTFRDHKIDIFHGVPYSLKLLAEDEEAVDLLAKCKMVVFGGSACPDTLGARLTERGVFIVSDYGS